MTNEPEFDQDLKDAVTEALPEVSDEDKENYELELWLSTDGKHTVRVKANSKDSRRQAVKKATELYDYIKTRYGTKQELNAKTYQGNNGHTEEKPSQEDCPHTTFKFAQVKKDGPNTGKWFKSCQACGKFMGWQ